MRAGGAGVRLDFSQPAAAQSPRRKVESDPNAWLSGSIALLAWWLAATSRWRTTSPLRATSDQTCLLQSIQKTKEIGLVGKSDFLRLRRRATTFRVCSRRRPSPPLLLWPPEIDGLCPRFPA